MRRSLAALAALVLAACSTSPVPSTGPSSQATGAPPTALASSAPAVTPGPTATPVPTPEPTPGPTVAQLIGQKLMVAMDGTTPSADLLGRIRRGEVGGVILFGKNITTEAALIALTKKLQAAAAAGGQPRLLISTDQEGGSVKRISWAPPTLAPSQMTSSADPTGTARNQGAATARALLKDGINVDLAPVADVPASTSSFMYLQGRTWSFSAEGTTQEADAFAAGMQGAGELPTMKHFPGLGYAIKNTDANVDRITVSTSLLDPGLDPYRGAIAQGLPLVMLSNAWYTAWDRTNAAGWSRTIGNDLLRGQLGFQGVTITDSLNGIAGALGVTARSLAIKAAAAGTDVILLTGTEASTKAAFTALVAAASGGSIDRGRLQASYDRILALKASLGS